MPNDYVQEVLREAIAKIQLRFPDTSVCDAIYLIEHALEVCDFTVN